MDNVNPSNTITITKQQFYECGINDDVSVNSLTGYTDISIELLKLARSRINEGQIEHGRILWLFAEACSMQLTPSSVNIPFIPLSVFGDKRSAMLDDFSEKEVNYFVEIFDEINNKLIKARVAEIIWLKQKRRSIIYPLTAIDCYRRIDLRTEEWITGGKECWERAISLSLLLGKGSGNRIKEIENQLTNALLSSTIEEGYLALWLSEILETYKLGRAQYREIAEKLENLATAFSKNGSINHQREMYSAAAKFFNRIGEKTKYAEMKTEVAESWIKEIYYRLSNGHDSDIVSTYFYEKAISEYRQIPKAERELFNVNERINELRKLLDESGMKSLSEMSVISTPEFDATHIVESVKNTISGKSFYKAIFSLVNISRGPQIDELRNTSIKHIQKFPLQFLVTENTISKDGIVKAKRPAYNFSNPNSSESQTTILADMIKNHEINMSIIAQCVILPAIDTLLLDHTIQESDLIDITIHSPFVPQERAKLVGKALFLGFNKDFITSIHILAPQVESIVRYHLKQIGVVTTVLDDNGIQNEIGLSSLMDIPETEKILGKQLVFEIKALFCSAFGPNIRNEIAHGLFDDDSCQNSYFIYAWWLVLKVVYNSWWKLYEPKDEIK